MITEILFIATTLIPVVASLVIIFGVAHKSNEPL
jgi:hypothetical protein